MRIILFFLLLPALTVAQYNQYPVTNFGAVPDKVFDCSPAIQAAYNAAAKTNGEVIYPSCTGAQGYRLTKTIRVSPLAGNAQLFGRSTALGGAINNALLIWDGSIDSSMFLLTGVKNYIFTGLQAVTTSGKTNITAWDVTTTVLSNSSSDVTFINCGAIFNSDSCVAFRYGHLNGGSSDGKDISNFHFVNCRIQGTDAKWSGGSSHFQYGFLNEGDNTLNFTWEGGFLNNLSRGYSNVSRAGTGAAENQGNSSVFFFGMGTSQNDIFIEAGAPGEYDVFGGRQELGNRMVETTLAGDNPIFNFYGVEVDSFNPSDSIVFNIKRPSSLIIIGGRCVGFHNKNFGSKMITMGGLTGSVGLLKVEGTTIQALGRFFNAASFYKVRLNNNPNYDSTTNVSTVWLPDYNSDSATAYPTIYNTDGALAANRSVTGGGARSLSLGTFPSQLTAFNIFANISAVANSPLIQLNGAISLSTFGATITTGSSSTYPAGTSNLLFNPSSAIASYTLTLPLPGSQAIDGQIVNIYAGGTIAANSTVVTAFTISPNTGQTIIQSSAPTILKSGDYISYVYNQSQAIWYRTH